jgi:hypothetical protein
LLDRRDGRIVNEVEATMKWFCDGPRWRSLVALFGGVLVVAVVGVGVWRWHSTQPSDPLGSQSGLGFDGVGEGKVPVGDEMVLTGYVLAQSPSSTATITKVVVPRVPGVRIRVFAIAGKPPDPYREVPTARLVPNGHYGDMRLVPLVGVHLHRPLAGFDTHGRPFLGLALTAAPLRKGCFLMPPITIRYRSTGSSFTKRTRWPSFVSTSAKTCAPVGMSPS